MSNLINNEDSQTYIVQHIVKGFVESGFDNFSVFCDVWDKLNGKTVSEKASYRNQLFGRCQGAFSTFIGLLYPEKRFMERLAGVFGLYLLFETQYQQFIQPIMLTVREFSYLREICDEKLETKGILRYLLKKSAFAFSASSIAVFSPYPEAPPINVPNDKPFHSFYEDSKVEKKVKFPFKPLDLNEIEDEYNRVFIDLIGENLN